MRHFFLRSPILWRRSALFLSALLLPLAFAPFHQWWLGMVSLGVLLGLSVKSQSGRAAFLDGASYGIGMFLAGIHWVYVSVGVFGGGGIVGGTLVTLVFIGYLALFPAFSTWVAFLLAGENTVLRRTLLALLWVVMEWLRGWFLTGFPWLFVGHAMIDSPLAAWAPVGGGLLLSALTLITIRSLLVVGESRSWRRFVPIGLMLILWGVAPMIDPLIWSRLEGQPLSVALVQGNMTQDQKWQPKLRDITIERYLQMTEPLWGQHDLIVWPETAVPDFFHTVGESLILPLYERVTQEKTTLMLGIPVLDFETYAYYNALLVLGDQPQWYFKRHLVPFGEYLPLRRWIGGHLKSLGLPDEDFSPGSERVGVVADRGFRAGLSICFEIVQTYLIRRDALEANYLVNISNDAWFGHSIAPHQHMQIARLRALETNRPLLRATNTGITAVIAADGQIIARAPQFEAAVVEGNISPRTGDTPYVRWGDTPLLGVVLLGLMFGGVAARRQRRQSKGATQEREQI